MKEKITVLLLLGILFTLPILSIIKNKETFSLTERRELASIKKEDILNFNKWEKYLTDHFIERENFKNLKAFISQNILQKKENKNTIQIENGLYEINNIINEKSIVYITNKINQIIKEYSKTKNIYYSIIPDKNYYLKETQIPKLNYSQFFNLTNQLLKDISYISIVNDLNLNSYYKTDIHWKQTEIIKVKETLLKGMNKKLLKTNYHKEKKYPFYGVLKSRLSNNLKPEEIEYLTNDEMNHTTVYNFELQKYQSVYQENFEDLKDGYDIFLNGATPLLIIENQNITENNELIIFRDSFGSSLVPLLIENYKKITVIDLRYISSSLLKNINEITWTENQDILFLYSIPVINNSFTLK